MLARAQLRTALAQYQGRSTSWTDTSHPGTRNFSQSIWSASETCEKPLKLERRQAAQTMMRVHVVLISATARHGKPKREPGRSRDSTTRSPWAVGLLDMSTWASARLLHAPRMLREADGPGVPPPPRTSKPAIRSSQCEARSG